MLLNGNACKPHGGYLALLINNLTKTSSRRTVTRPRMDKVQLRFRLETSQRKPCLVIRLSADSAISMDRSRAVHAALP